MALIEGKRSWHPVFLHFPPRRRFSKESLAEQGSGKCVTVASQKGGVGKTTTAVNLAAGFGLSGRKTLLMDLDLQGNATSGVQMAGSAGESDRSSQGTDPSSGILASLEEKSFLDLWVRETEFENLWVFPFLPELSDLKEVHALLHQRFQAWKQQMDSLKKSFDRIFIDCPPSLEGLPTLALSTSDELIIPIQCEYYAMEGLSQILPVVERLQKSRNPGLQIAGLLLTMYSNELDLSKDVATEINGYFPDLVYRSIIPRDVTLAESASHGLPIFYYEPFSRGAWSYLELTREVLTHELT